MQTKIANIFSTNALFFAIPGSNSISFIIYLDRNFGYDVKSPPIILFKIFFSLFLSSCS